MALSKNEKALLLKLAATGQISKQELQQAIAEGGEAVVWINTDGHTYRRVGTNETMTPEQMKAHATGHGWHNVTLNLNT